MMDVAAIRVEALDYARNEGVLNKAKHHLVAVAKSVECKLDGIKSPSARRAGASFALALGIMLLFMLLTPHCAAAFGLDDLVTGRGNDRLLDRGHRSGHHEVPQRNLSPTYCQPHAQMHAGRYKELRLGVGLALRL